ncbi:MAG: glutamate formimidoyltransferase [Anaerolineaceae bacterium]|nr:glutamate formimidoyltransferase [Anaerolineaceae bacterium]
MMAIPLVECIPNFSEARRPEVVKLIRDSIEAVPGVTVMDQHSDLDHNRTVLTFVGPPAAVEEAAFQSIATAGKLIDLDQHRGEHPRIGATDVVPFVPIREVSMLECVEMARRLGRRVGEELHIPVYLYEEAATSPGRQNLENIRKGQYEGLKEEILIDSDRIPDYGPRELGPAGATVIGARHPLIAFNVYLTTDNVGIAQHIARTIRHSTGGLRYVKALGLLVHGRAQVSMNLTNFRQTSIARVMEMIRSEARRYGVGIYQSELVGLIPQEALNDAAVWYLQLDVFEPGQILEHRLAALLREKPADELELHLGEEPGFLDQLASASPTPGGGCAAAYAAASAAALAAMVARSTVKKKKYAAVEADMWHLIDQAELLRTRLTDAAQKDAEAYQALVLSQRLPHNTAAEQAQRAAAIEQATLQAARIPYSIVQDATAVLALAAQAAALGNVNALPDAGSSAALARAAITAGGLNIRTNLSTLPSHPEAQVLLAGLLQLEGQAGAIETSLQVSLKERGNLLTPEQQ